MRRSKNVKHMYLGGPGEGENVVELGSINF